MVKTKTKIERQTLKKTGDVVGIIRAAKKSGSKVWLEIARVLSGPRKNFQNLNLSEIDNKVEDGENIIVPGKILSQGNLNKKIRVVALGFSENAKEKLLNAEITTSSIMEEIEKNPEGRGLKILERKK